VSTQEIINIGLLLSPIFLIQLALVIYALVDLSRKSQTRGPRWVWALVLVLTALAIPTGIIVAGVYLAWGRHPGVENDTD
jgi:heme A synthase